VTHLSTVVASIGIVGHNILHRNIVGHTLVWCVRVSLLLGSLVAILLLVLRALLVLVLIALRVLALLPLVRGPLIPLEKALLRKTMWASVATRCLPVKLPLLDIHFLALVVDHNSMVQ
jgi:hypothetical protein